MNIDLYIDFMTLNPKLILNTGNHVSICHENKFMINNDASQHKNAINVYFTFTFRNRYRIIIIYAHKSILQISWKHEYIYITHVHFNSNSTCSPNVVVFMIGNCLSSTKCTPHAYTIYIQKLYHTISNMWPGSTLNNKNNI